MTLTRTETIAGMQREYEAFADLVATLDDEQWHAPSRCGGWEARDVAGHVIGLAEDVAAGKPGSRTAEEEGASIRILSPAEAAAHLRASVAALAPLAAVLDDDDVWAGPSGAPGLTMGEGVLTLWYDTYVHADDIRQAAGLASVAGPGLQAAVVYLDDELAKRGVDLDRSGIADHDFVLAATGRLDAAPLGLDPAVNIYAG